jgi:hypothetical protein
MGIDWRSECERKQLLLGIRPIVWIQGRGDTATYATKWTVPWCRVQLTPARYHDDIMNIDSLDLERLVYTLDGFTDHHSAYHIYPL